MAKATIFKDLKILGSNFNLIRSMNAFLVGMTETSSVCNFIQRNDL